MASAELRSRVRRLDDINIGRVLAHAVAKIQELLEGGSDDRAEVSLERWESVLGDTDATAAELRRVRGRRGFAAESASFAEAEKDRVPAMRRLSEAINNDERDVVRRLAPVALSYRSAVSSFASRFRTMLDNRKLVPTAKESFATAAFFRVPVLRTCADECKRQLCVPEDVDPGRQQYDVQRADALSSLADSLQADFEARVALRDKLCEEAHRLCGGDCIPTEIEESHSLMYQTAAYQRLIDEWHHCRAMSYARDLCERVDAELAIMTGVPAVQANGLLGVLGAEMAGDSAKRPVP